MDKKELKKLKLNRLKPEEQFILGIFDGLVKEESLVIKGNYLYIKDGYCYFYHSIKSATFYYDVEEISNYIELKFGFGYFQTCDLVYNMVKLYFKIYDISVHSMYLYRFTHIIEHLKLRKTIQIS